MFPASSHPRTARWVTEHDDVYRCVAFLENPDQGVLLQGRKSGVCAPVAQGNFPATSGGVPESQVCNGLAFATIRPAQQSRRWGYSANTPCSNKCFLRLSEIDRWGGGHQMAGSGPAVARTRAVGAVLFVAALLLLFPSRARTLGRGSGFPALCRVARTGEQAASEGRRPA